MRAIGVVSVVMAVVGLAVPAGAWTYQVKDDFETAWTGDYAPHWDCEGYRHGDEPVAKMEQVDLTGTGRSGYGAKVYVDSVPESWMWWAAVNRGHVASRMTTAYDPWLSVYMYDAGYTSDKDVTGQLYTVPSLVTGEDDWTDVQFGGRTVAETVYYYTWADSPHPPWQATTVARPDLDATPPDSAQWVHLKIQLASADNKLHFYLDGTEVGTSTRADYTDIGSLILADMFDDPLSDWGASKPYVIFDNFEFGSTWTPEPATLSLLGLGAVAAIIRRRRVKRA